MASGHLPLVVVVVVMVVMVLSESFYTRESWL